MVDDERGAGANVIRGRPRIIVIAPIPLEFIVTQVDYRHGLSVRNLDSVNGRFRATRQTKQRILDCDCCRTSLNAKRNRRSRKIPIRQGARRGDRNDPVFESTTIRGERRSSKNFGDARARPDSTGFSQVVNRLKMILNDRGRIISRYDFHHPGAGIWAHE